MTDYWFEQRYTDAFFALRGRNPGEPVKAPFPSFVRTEQTCYGCPSQWDAWDADGNQYYLRFRWGCGTLSLRGRMVAGEIEYLDRGEEIVSFDTGDGLDGIISLDEFLERARRAYEERP